MGGGGFMKYADNANRQFKDQKNQRRTKFKSNRADEATLTNDSTQLNFDHLSEQEVKNERARIATHFKARKRKKRIVWFTAVCITGLIVFVGLTFKTRNYNPFYSVGEVIDTFNNVDVYYNGGVDNVSSRNTVDGYNLGLEYQCVEFVKRYYYEVYDHKMPNSYGHAKDYFDPYVKDGEVNGARGLFQYSNRGKCKPKVGDIVIFDATVFNAFGHVAIVSHVTDNRMEVVQQNAGPFQPSREEFEMNESDGKWVVLNKRIVGWLRK